MPISPGMSFIAKKKKFLLHTHTLPQSRITRVASSRHILLFIHLERVLNFSLSFVTLTLWEITGWLFSQCGCTFS